MRSCARFRLARRTVVALALMVSLGAVSGVAAAAPFPRKNSELCRQARATFQVIHSFEYLKSVDAEKNLDFDPLADKFVDLVDSVKKLEQKAPPPIKGDLRRVRELLEEIKKDLPLIKNFFEKEQLRQRQKQQKSGRSSRLAADDATLEALLVTFRPLAEKARGVMPAVNKLLQFFSTECDLK